MLNKQCVCVKLKPDNKITCFSDYSIYFKVFPKSSAIKSRGRQPLKHEDVQGCKGFPVCTALWIIHAQFPVVLLFSALFTLMSCLLFSELCGRMCIFP